MSWENLNYKFHYHAKPRVAELFVNIIVMRCFHSVNVDVNIGNLFFIS